MTVGASSVIMTGHENVARTTYTTASVTHTAGRFRLLFVTSRQSTGASVAPTSISGLGYTWQKLAERPLSNGNYTWSVWRGYVASGGTGVSGPITITHGSTMTSCHWSLCETAQVDTTTPIPTGQIGQAGTANTTNSITLPSPTGSGNAILVAYAVNQELETYTLQGDLQLIAENGVAWGSKHVFAIDLSGGQTVSIAPGATGGKAMFAMELADAVTANQPPTVTTSQTGTVKPGSTVTITASGSDPDGTIASYTWTHNAPSSAVTVNNNILTFVCPFDTANITYNFTVTVADNSGSTGQTTRSVAVPLHQDWIRFPDGTWHPIGDVAASSPTTPISTTLQATAGDGTATLNWTIASNGNNVTGAIEGRSGPGGVPAEQWFEPIPKPGISGSRIYTNLTNGQTYKLWIKPVIGSTPQARVEVDVTPTASTPPPPPPTTTDLGMYNGNPNENPDGGPTGRYQVLFGVNPEIQTTYLVLNLVNETYERGRLSRGTDIIFDMDPKEVSQAGTIYSLSQGTVQGDNYVIPLLQACQRVAASSTTGAKVRVALAHEWEVKRAQNRWTDLRDADPTNFAKALDRFATLAEQHAPLCEVGFWTGGHENNHSVLAQVMSLMTKTMKWVSIDPYITNTTETFLVNWKRYGVDFFKANTTYTTNWGNPPIFVTEFGINTDGVADSLLATRLTDLRKTMRDAGVSGAVYYNRDRADEAANHMWKLDNGDTPLALEAFKKSVTGASTEPPPEPPPPDPGTNVPAGWKVYKIFDLSRQEPGWVSETGKTNNAGYNQMANVSFGARGQVVTARRQAMGGLPFTTADAQPKGTGQILPNYFRCRAVWYVTRFHKGLWPAIWFRPFPTNVGYQGEIDWHEAFGGHIPPSPFPRIHGCGVIKTPYGTGQKNYIQNIDYTRVGDDSILGVTRKHVYEWEKTQGRMRCWIDGVLIATFNRSNSSMSVAEWDTCFENPGQGWYFRHCIQIGDDPDGQPSGNAGPVPDSFTSMESILESLEFFVPI